MSTANNKQKQQELLQGIDGIGKVQAPAFFYARLRARMERQTGNEKPGIILLRPSFLLTGMVLVCLLNIFLLADNQNKKASYINKNSSSAGIESFANEYDLTSSGSFDLNN